MDAFLVRHAGGTDVEDAGLVAQAARFARASPRIVVRMSVHRALNAPDTYVYLELATSVADGDGAAIERAARDEPAFAHGALTVERLERKLAPPAASAGEPAHFLYVVETDAAPGWDDELARWYDTEHMPGLAAVPGCVRAQRYVNRDGLPWSHACYDLVKADVTASPEWLAVRATAWSDRVRPQFRNTRRTMFRTLPVSSAPSAP